MALSNINSPDFSQVQVIQSAQNRARLAKQSGCTSDEAADAINEGTGKRDVPRRDMNDFSVNSREKRAALWQEMQEQSGYTRQVRGIAAYGMVAQQALRDSLQQSALSLYV